jgi:hypothetical protein
MRNRPSLVVFLAGVGGAACGKDDAEKFADRYCAEFAECCAQAGLRGDGSLCRMAMSGGNYNAQAGEACLDEVKAQVAAGTFCTSLSQPSVCNSVFASPNGNKQPGDTCEFDSDCANSSEGTVACAGLYDGTTWTHKCQLRKPGQVGTTPCIGTQDGIMFLSYDTSGATDVTPSGYVCDTADGIECQGGTCVALAAVGEACTFTSDCVRTAFCDGTKHQCTARLTAGSACTGSDADECVAGYYCPTSGPQQCTVKLAAGAQCSADAMCESDMCSDSTCQPGFLDTLGLAMLCG